MAEQPKQQLEVETVSTLSLEELQDIATKRHQGSAGEIIKGSSKYIHVFPAPEVRDGLEESIAIMINQIKGSIFDLKDKIVLEIPLKDQLETLYTAYVFSKLTERGIGTHLLGVVNREGSKEKVVSFKDLTELTPKLATLWLQRPNDNITNEAGYKVYAELMRTANETGKGVIAPFEFVIRNQLVFGVSSCTRQGEVKWEKFKLDNNMPELPTYDEIQARKGEIYQLSRPVLDLTTKYEKGGDNAVDRITYNRLMEIRDGDDITYTYDKLNLFALTANKIIKEAFLDLGIVIPDLKIEVGLNGNGELIVLDVIGPDEVRMFLDNPENDPEISGLDFSKQFFRGVFEETLWLQIAFAFKQMYKSNWQDKFGELALPQPALNPQVYYALEKVNEIQKRLLLKFTKTDVGNPTIKELQTAVAQLEKTVADLSARGELFSGDVAVDVYKQHVPDEYRLDKYKDEIA